MSNTAQYYIAQYIPEPFRKESTNVGVVVARDGELAAKFYGENANGVVKKVAERRVRHPGIYTQWVGFWRRCVEDGEPGIDTALKQPRVNFQLIPGGVVSNLGEDDPQTIATNLYERLVSEDADMRPEMLRRRKNLEVAIANALHNVKGYNLLDENLHIKFPMQQSKRVLGAAVHYVPSFIHWAKTLSVMQAVDITRATGSRVIELRAGWVAHMFDDIRERNPGTQGVVLLRADETPENSTTLRRLERIITRHNDKVVNWRNSAQRSEFLEERLKVALST